jgi:ubiquinone/menaquinone biosynthesis C-methylase UbiE
MTENIDKSTDEINSPQYLSSLKEYLKGAEGTWYYDGIYKSHTDISRFFGWLDYLERYGTMTGTKTLDVGCGSGGMPIAMIKRGAREVYGLEVDKALYDICSVRFRSITSAQVFLGDGSTLPFESDSFDMVTSIHVIEHVSQMETFLAEIFRVLKKGGKCIIDCPNRYFPVEPHNNIPLITYLPKSIADFICADLLSSLPLLKPDMKLRLKNVASFNHFISTGKLVKMVSNMGGDILLRNPVERFVGGSVIVNNITSSLGKRFSELLSFWLSRNAMVIFSK